MTALTNKLMITPLALSKIKFWVARAKGECSWLGQVKRFKEGDLITDVHMVKQVNGPASTVMDHKSVLQLQYRLRKSRKGELRCWGHSHSNMQVFFSGTDDATMKDLAGKGWLYATVHNKKGEIYTCYYQGATEEYPEIFTDKIELVETALDKDVKAWAKEFDDNCEDYVPKYKPTGKKRGGTLLTTTEAMNDYTVKEKVENPYRKSGNRNNTNKNSCVGIVHKNLKHSISKEVLGDWYEDYEATFDEKPTPKELEDFLDDFYTGDEI